MDRLIMVRVLVEERKDEQNHYCRQQKTAKEDEGWAPARYTHPIVVVADLLVMKVGDYVVRVVPDTFGGY